MIEYRIFKYEADENGTYFVPDAAATVLLVAQRGASVFPFIWCKINVHAEMGFRQFQCVGTGHKVERGSVIVGSAVCGAYVWHVVEVTP